MAQAAVGSTFNESMFTTKTPLPVSYDAPRFSSVDDHPVPNAKSDHEMKFFYDDEGHREIPRSRWITNPIHSRSRVRPSSDADVRARLGCCCHNQSVK